jgi:hypothetical protein
MQSISVPAIQIVPVDTTNHSNDSDYDVLQIDRLLNKIFGDELDKALAAEAANEQSSNLIEFPLVQELLDMQIESTAPSNTLDFSPTAFGLDDPVLETDLTKFTPSIIEGDDVDYGHMQTLVDAQQEQLATLRAELKQKDIVIRRQSIDLASKDDQLKYLPELFDKALRLANAEANNMLLTKDLEVEKLVNEELNSELGKTRQSLNAINSHLLVKFGRVLGVIG